VGAMTFSKMTLNITTFSIQQSAEPNIALIMAEQWYAVSLAECHYAESRWAVFGATTLSILSVVAPNTALLMSTKLVKECFTEKITFANGM